MMWLNGVEVCWSCNEEVAQDVVRDNDGYCPYCQAEIIEPPEDDE